MGERAYRWLSWVAVPEGGKVYCVARDITSRKELEASEAASKASLLDEQAAAALREQFIAVLGHDLRNPLSAITSAMHLLLRTKLEERAKTLVAMTQGSAIRMASLIENLMDFARGRLGGGLMLDRAEWPLEPVIRQIVEELSIGQPSRVIETEFALTVPVHCDARRIGQLVSNLVSNALTHGASDASISLIAKTSNGALELSVTNRGKPIPKSSLSTIFEPFSRGEGRGSLQGLGLGLYISNEIAMAHGGSLKVASTPIETRFTFILPLA
jgi:sigma-B regulation protein RsbU (phosphoserine phosphatase)